MNNLASLIFCKGTLTYTATSLEARVLPLDVQNILKEFDDVFPKKVPIGLPLFRGIKHQFDLVPGATLPNRLEYTKNLEEAKVINLGSRFVG